MRMHRTALMAGCLISTSLLAGAALASTQNPDTKDARPMGINSGGDTDQGLYLNGVNDDLGGRYDLSKMTCLSDDRAPGLPGASGHIAYAADLGIDDSPPAYMVAGLLATSAMTDFGAVAPS